MDHRDYVALRAKVYVANRYLEQVLKCRGKFDNYDIRKVVTWSMTPHVEVVSVEQASMDGLGFVRIREGVA